MKKVLAFALAAVLAVGFLAACTPAAAPSSTPASAGASSQAASDPAGLTYGGNDVSEEMTLRFLMVAPVEAPDHDLVWEKINEHIKPIINATVEPTILLQADHDARYALELQSGEAYDLVFTAKGWMHYDQEAPAGAFKEITVELVNQYMPLTTQYQTDLAMHLEQNSIDGKCYMVPQSGINIGINCVALVIREDLRVANEAPEITDVASLEAYYDSVKASNPEMFPYATSIENNAMKGILFNIAHNKIKSQGSIFEDFFNADWVPGQTPAEAIEAFTYVGYDEDYVVFAQKMKEWADKGYWSRSAIADTTLIRDAFENGSSASFAGNTGTAGLAANAVRAKGWESKMYDLYPESTRFMGTTGSGLAVPFNSEKMERALMFIDLLKYDEVPYELFRFGIEGTHWEWVDEASKIWKRGPANADENNQGYQYGQGSWGFASPEFEPRNMEGADPDSVRIYNSWNEDRENNPLASLALDAGPIANEIADLTDIRARFLYLLDFGLVDDVETMIEQMNAEAEAAGLQRVIDEIQAQAAAWLARQPEA